MHKTENSALTFAPGEREVAGLVPQFVSSIRLKWLFFICVFTYFSFVSVVNIIAKSKVSNNLFTESIIIFESHVQKRPQANPYLLKFIYGYIKRITQFNVTKDGDKWKLLYWFRVNDSVIIKIFFAQIKSRLNLKILSGSYLACIYYFSSNNYLAIFSFADRILKYINRSISLADSSFKKAIGVNSQDYCGAGYKPISYSFTPFVEPFEKWENQSNGFKSAGLNPLREFAILYLFLPLSLFWIGMPYPTHFELVK